METIANGKVAYNKHKKNKCVNRGDSGCIGGGGVNRGEFCIPPKVDIGEKSVELKSCRS